MSDRFGGYSSINDFSSGRIELYAQVIDQINLTGHNPEEVQLTYLNQVYSAHNAVLEFTFVCGIFTRLLYLFIELIMVVKAVQVAFGKGIHYSGNWFAIFAVFSYVCVSILEMQTTFIHGSLVLTFYLATVILESDKQLQK